MLVKVCDLGLGNVKSVILLYLIEKTNWYRLVSDMLSTCPIILHVSIKVSQFKEYQIVIVLEMSCSRSGVLRTENSQVSSTTRPIPVCRPKSRLFEQLTQC